MSTTLRLNVGGKVDVIDDGRRGEQRVLIDTIAVPIEGDVGENTRDIMDCVPLVKNQRNRIRGSLGRAEREEVAALRAVVDLELVVGTRMARTEHEEPKPIPLFPSDYILILHLPHRVVAWIERRIQKEEQTHHGCSRRPCPEGTSREAGSIG